MKEIGQEIPQDCVLVRNYLYFLIVLNRQQETGKTKGVATNKDYGTLDKNCQAIYIALMCSIILR
jgi:hypothetical protein